MDNYSSTVAPAVRAKVENALLEEIAAGNCFLLKTENVISSKKPAIISSLSVVSKPNSEEIRLIHDCSQPSGSAVNDHTDTESLKYQSLQDAIKVLKPRVFYGQNRSSTCLQVCRDSSQQLGCYGSEGEIWQFQTFYLLI